MRIVQISTAIRRSGVGNGLIIFFQCMHVAITKLPWDLGLCTAPFLICTEELHPNIVAWSLEARPRLSKPPHASEVLPWPARTPPAVVESLFPALQSKTEVSENVEDSSVPSIKKVTLPFPFLHGEMLSLWPLEQRRQHIRFHPRWPLKPFVVEVADVGLAPRLP